MAPPAPAFDTWIQALETRVLQDLTFAEVSRALRALSSTYVQRRGRLGEGAALAGAGKRAAFALFYGPLHFLLIQEIVRALPARGGVKRLVDLGCGTGVAGAAWATECAERPDVLGIDRHPWALGEAARTYRAFGLRARTRQGDVASALMPKPPASIVAAFCLNELPDAARDQLLRRLMDHPSRGHSILVVEPIARHVTPWWDQWRRAFVAAGGRDDDWRFTVPLPAIVAKLDRAAGLDHRELTGRSLWLQRTD
jgi:SAM-dependent methyltransferase